MPKTIFISHKDTERAVAEALANYVLSSLEVNESEIQCTSVPRFALQFGKTISTQLRENIDTSAIVFAILTQSSLKSHWVQFELGASWALSKTVVPILGPGLTEKDLPGPLDGYPSIKIGDSRAPLSVAESMRQAADILGVAEKVGGNRQQLLDLFVTELSGLQLQPGEQPTGGVNRRETVKVRTESSAAVFGELRISVVAIEFTGSPSRHRVFARLNVSKHATYILDNVEPGFAVNYAGFDIYVMSVDTWYATFDISEVGE